MGHTACVRITFLLVATSLVALSVAAQEVGYKDLTQVGANPLKHTKFIPDTSCNGGIGPGLGVGIGCPPATYPFKLSLLSMDTSELPLGGEVIVLLRLSNEGRHTASVPWLTDPDEIEMPDENGTFKFSVADLRANILQEGGGTAYINLPVHLYGANEVPAGIQEIHPGEYVELKVKVGLDCKAEGVDCRSVKAGPARLSLTWSEWDARETYEKCSIQSMRSRTRELTSDLAVINVIGRALQ